MAWCAGLVLQLPDLLLASVLLLAPSGRRVVVAGSVSGTAEAVHAPRGLLVLRPWYRRARNQKNPDTAPVFLNPSALGQP